MRDCDNCARCGRDGCKSWDCDFVPRKEAIEAWKEKYETADRKTENSSEKPNNCEPKTGEMMTEEEFDSMLARVLIGKDEPQPNADQHVQRIEYVGNDEKSRCWTCKHFERMHETPISSDGSYYTYVVCTAKECKYEPKDEPQTEREGE